MDMALIFIGISLLVVLAVFVGGIVFFVRHETRIKNGIAAANDIKDRIKNL